MRPEVKHPAQNRAMRTSRGPTISVIIASHQPRAVLDRCLSALVSQCGEVGAEVVVVRGGAMPPAIVARKSSSNVKFVPVAPDASVAEMRTVGASAASGDIILFADAEVVTADPGFAARLRAMAAGSIPAAQRVPDPERADAVRAYLRERQDEQDRPAVAAPSYSAPRSSVPSLTV